MANIFNLKPHSEIIMGNEEMFQDYVNGKYLIGFEFDIWSGFTIVAKSKDSEKLLDEIFLWIRNYDDITKIFVKKLDVQR